MPARDDSRESARRRPDERDRRDERRREPSRRRDYDRRGDYDRRDDGDRDDRRRRRSRSRRREEDAAMALALRRPSRSKSQPRKRRSGFDLKDMMPENYAMMQLAKTTGGPPPGAGGMGMGMDSGQMGMGMPPPNTVPNPEVELFLQHNPVEPHGAQRLRSLPVELQTVVLQSGSLFGARDPTAVLLSRIRTASSGLRTSRGTGMYPPAYGQPPTAMTGSSMPPGGTGVLGMTPSELPQAAQAPAPSVPQQAYQAPQSSTDMAQMWAEMNRGRAGDENQVGQSNSGSWTGNNSPENSLENQNQGQGTPWGYQKQEKQEYDYGYGPDGSKPWYEAKAEETQRAKNSWNAEKDSYAKGDPKGCQRVDGKGDGKGYDTGDGKGKETPEMAAMRGKMQSSIADLSASLLGKNEAQKAGLVNEAGQVDAEFGGEDPGSTIPKRSSAPAPPLNPFRSKPRAALVEPDPPPLDPPVDFSKFQSKPQPEPEPAQVQQQQQQQEQQLRQQLQQHQLMQQQQQQREPEQPQPPPPPQSQPQQMEVQIQVQDQPMLPYQEQDQRGYKGGWNSSQDNNNVQAYSTSKFDMPMPQQPQHTALPEPEPEPTPWTAERLTSFNLPPGILVRKIRQNKVVLMPSVAAKIESFQACTAAAIEKKLAEVAAEGSKEAPAEISEEMAAATAAAERMGASSNPEMKKAQAIATLSYYGLTDPANAEDVAKAVSAVATATGDQETAIALWHQVNGTDVTDPSGQNLTEEQQAEIHEAAVSAQYSQYWLQQQFQSQLAMFENQRLMAGGDNPVTTVEDAKESALKGPKGDSGARGGRKTNQPMLPGDWTCPGCGDHQFARNRVCRFCGASRPLGSA